MKKRELADMMASSKRSQSEAADRLDRAVEEILRKLKSGKEVHLPGLGRLIPGPGENVRFEQTRERRQCGK